MAGQRTNLASLATASVEDVPGRGTATLSTLPLDSIVPTPINPRTDFGTPEKLAELGASMQRRQLQPIVVVTRALYLKRFPEHTEQAGSEQTSYVIAVGERRYRAALAAGLGTIEAVVRDEVAATRQEFVDAVLSENLDRKNFDPIEEAHAIELLVREFKTARAAANHRGKTEGWVSQRRALLRLAEPVQALVRNRELSVETARVLAKVVKDQKLDAQQQLDWWAAQQASAKLQVDTLEASPDTADPTRQPGDSTVEPQESGASVSSERESPGPSDHPPAQRKEKAPPAETKRPNTVPRQTSPGAPVASRSDGVFAELTTQPKALAAALAAELTTEDLLVLVEELHAFV